MASKFPRPTLGDILAKPGATYPHLLIKFDGFYERERVNVSAGAWPIAQIGRKCSLVIYPEPFDAEGTLSEPCQAFLIDSVQKVAKQTGYRMVVVWGPASCSFVEADGSITNPTKALTH